MFNDLQTGASIIGNILVLEDELLLAIVMGDCMLELGAADVVICTTIAEAEQAIADRRFDCAVLDVCVGGALSFPIADRLAEQGIPFVFGTASLRDEFPDRHSGIALLSKPFSNEELAEAVRKAVAALPETA